ncbi:MAG: hypothetical protein RLZZ550_989 [Verrucomicrobiota bacterium]|jgi:hypothetical protein
MPVPPTSLPPANNAELALSVERAYREGEVLDRLEALWALILAKCFVLQWAIDAYALPVRGLVYVWLLTLAMAAAATGLYLRAHRLRLGLLPWRGRVTTALLVGLLVGLGALAYAHGARGLLPAGAAAALACVLLGNAALVRAALVGGPEPLAGALVWWAAGAQAFRDDEGRALLWVGLGFLAAQALPGFARLARRRREQRV